MREDRWMYAVSTFLVVAVITVAFTTTSTGTTRDTGLDGRAPRRRGHGGRLSRALLIAVLPALLVTACSGSDGTDDEPPSIGGINGPAVVDPSFDPFATDPSAPPATDGG